MERVSIAFVALFLFAPCVLASGQKAARTLELNQQNYDNIRNALSCREDELSWREIPWRPNLGEAIVEARKKQKPILLWIMNGHPCGMT